MGLFTEATRFAMAPAQAFGWLGDRIEDFGKGADNAVGTAVGNATGVNQLRAELSMSNERLEELLGNAGPTSGPNSPFAAVGAAAGGLARLRDGFDSSQLDVDAAFAKLASESGIDSATASSEKLSAAMSYEVQAGDTLSSIAEEKGMSLDELLAENEIENPDMILAGQQLNLGGGPGGGLVAEQSALDTAQGNAPADASLTAPEFEV